MQVNANTQTHARTPIYCHNFKINRIHLNYLPPSSSSRHFIYIGLGARVNAHAHTPDSVTEQRLNPEAKGRREKEQTANRANFSKTPSLQSHDFSSAHEEQRQSLLRAAAAARPLTTSRMFTAMFPSTLHASNFFFFSFSSPPRSPKAVADRKASSLGLPLSVQSGPPCPGLDPRQLLSCVRSVHLLD